MKLPSTSRARTRQLRRYVLDANALIGFFEGRPTVAGKVRQLLADALNGDMPLLMSAINWGEVFYTAGKLYGERGANETESKLQQMPVVVIGVDRERATRAARLKQKYSLGYADAFAAELAIENSAWLVTADPDFSKLGNAISIYSLPRFDRNSPN